MDLNVIELPQGNDIPGYTPCALFEAGKDASVFAHKIVQELKISTQWGMIMRGGTMAGYAVYASNDLLKKPAAPDSRRHIDPVFDVGGEG